MDPAYAGINLGAKHTVALIIRGPRVCGDEPMDNPMAMMYDMWTPRMRG